MEDEDEEGCGFCRWRFLAGHEYPCGECRRLDQGRYDNYEDQEN